MGDAAGVGCRAEMPYRLPVVVVTHQCNTELLVLQFQTQHSAIGTGIAGACSPPETRLWFDARAIGPAAVDQGERTQLRLRLRAIGRVETDMVDAGRQSSPIHC